MPGSTARQKRYLKPGDLWVAREPTLVTTVLGSCVSITLFGPRLRAGAICHALLPEGECEARDPKSFRFLNCAFEHMLEGLEGLGLAREEIQAKAFGGALGVSPGGGRFGVGTRNAELARSLLADAGLRLAASDLGGTQGRKLLFYTDTGEVFIRLLRGGAPQQLG